mmetsp:Transcript_48437/g.114268  ORF Transcript_48437/g.114268 Transcript_48437/m.114268 type:complete len:332 (+) Transcript_48437:237-1232(+)
MRRSSTSFSRAVMRSRALSNASSATNRASSASSAASCAASSSSSASSARSSAIFATASAFSVERAALEAFFSDSCARCWTAESAARETIPSCSRAATCLMSMLYLPIATSSSMLRSSTVNSSAPAPAPSASASSSVPSASAAPTGGLFAGSGISGSDGASSSRVARSPGRPRARIDLRTARSRGAAVAMARSSASASCAELSISPRSVTLRFSALHTSSICWDDWRGVSSSSHFSATWCTAPSRPRNSTTRRAVAPVPIFSASTCSVSFHGAPTTSAFTWRALMPLVGVALTCRIRSFGSICASACVPSRRRSIQGKSVSEGSRLALIPNP